MEQVEYPGMSGTNTIAVTTVLIETGMVPSTEPVTELVLESPAGLITVRAEVEGGKVKSVTFENVPWLQEIGQEEDGIIMHPDDAVERGIKTGDRVRVWNDRGEMWLKAFVTNTIARGCTVTARGTSYKPTQPGVIGCPTNGGGSSVLTIVGRTGSLNVGSASGSCAVQVEKI